MNKPVLKWTPAVPARIKDNLISSAAREKNQTGFTPSYESEKKQHMNFLMSNEYMRIWFKERGKYEKDIYSREQTIKEESKIRRRVVQRMMTFRKPLKNDFIDDMIQKKSQQPVEVPKEKILRKMKFRPECHQKKKGEAVSSTAKAASDAAPATAADGAPTPATDGAPKTAAKGASKAASNQKSATSANQTKSKSKVKDKTKKGTEADEDECDDGGEVVVLCADTVNVECCCENKE